MSKLFKSSFTKTIILCFVLLSGCLKDKLRNNLDKLEQEGRLSEAVDEFKSRILKNTDDPFLHYELAGVYERMGEFDKAMQEYKATVIFDKSYEPKVNSKIASIFLKNARVESAAGALEKAVANYKSALALSPEQAGDIKKEIVSVYRNSAENNLRASNFNQAMSDFSEILKYDEKNQEALTGQIACLMGQKKYDQANQEIEKLKTAGLSNLDEMLSELKYRLGEMSFNSGDYTNAKEYYDSALAISPQFAEKLKGRYLELENFSLKKMIDGNDLDNALSKLKELKAVRVDPLYGQMEADIYEKQKKKDLMVSKYEELLSANPSNKGYYRKLIRAYQDDGSVVEEMKIKKQELSVFGFKEMRDIAEDIAKYEISKGNFKDALTLYSKLSESFPKDGKYLYEQVLLYIKLRDNKKAKAVLDNATKTDPKLASVYSAKYDTGFKIYVRKEFYIKLAAISLGVLVFVIGLIRFISKRRERLIYQTI